METATLNLDSVEDLFYRSQFNEVITTIDNYIEKLAGDTPATNLLLIKANALFELHQIDQCKLTLEQACINSAEDDVSDVV